MVSKLHIRKKTEISYHFDLFNGAKIAYKKKHEINTMCICALVPLEWRLIKFKPKCWEQFIEPL